MEKLMAAIVVLGAAAVEESPYIEDVENLLMRMLDELAPTDQDRIVNSLMDYVSVGVPHE